MEVEIKKRLEEYDWVGGFSEGLAPARKDEKEFHIREDGNPAYEQRFDWVGAFRDGTAEVRSNGKSFHIHPNGTKVNCPDPLRIQ